MKRIFISAFLVFAGLGISAQNNVGIGTNTPNPKSLLDLTATDKGFLVPRLTTAQRLAIAPAGAADAALLVYDTDQNLFYFWNGAQWVPFPQAGGSDNISFTYNPATGLLTITDGAGPLSVNLPVDNDSDPTNEVQQLTLNGNTLNLSISNNNVDLSPYLDNTDNQNLTSAVLNGTTLTISIQNGNPVSVDLGSLLGTDNQTLTLTGTNLSITNGNTVDLSPFLDNTDNQTLTLLNNQLTISNGNTVDLSSLANDWKLLGNAGTSPGVNFLGTTDAQDLVFRTNNVERVRTLASNGNVGIGTNAPAHKLMIVDESNAPFGIYEYNNFDGANIRGYRARGTPAAPLAIQANDPITRLSAFGYDGASFVQRGQLSIEAAENWSTGSNGTQIIFRTTQNGTVSSLERMRLTHNGNLGIGTGTPNFRLHLNDASGGPFGSPAIQLTNNLTGAGVNDGTRLASSGLDFWVDNRSNGNLLFATNTFERIRITAAGLVGVATTTPQNRMDVAGSMAVGTFAGVNAAPANGFIVSGNVRIGVAAANTIAPAAADNALITFDVTGGYTRIGNYNSDPGVGGVPPGSSFTAGVGALAVGMNRTGGTSNVDFWNTTSHSQATANGTGDRGFNWRRYNNSGAEQLLMTLDGFGNLTIAGTSYFTSDSRIKTNVRPMEERVLDKILQLIPSRYNKTNAAYDEKGRLVFYPENASTEADFGFLAQDVYKVFPELVSKPKDESKELWAVDYARLSVMLVKALQEQQAIIENLKAENYVAKSAGKGLQERMEALEAEVEELKSLMRQMIYTVSR